MKELSKLNSAALSDALDSLGIEGALLGMKLVSGAAKVYGPAYTVKYQAYAEKPSSFQGAADYIDEVPAGSIIIIDNEARVDCTVWGGILSRYACQKGIKATVINGACRDVRDSQALSYPLYSKGITMRSGKNRVYKSQQQSELTIGLVNIMPGDMVFADEDGALVIPHQHLSEVIRRAHNIQKTEQNIIEAVTEGHNLADARAKHGYHQPWLVGKA